MTQTSRKKQINADTHEQKDLKRHDYEINLIYWRNIKHLDARLNEANTSVTITDKSQSLKLQSGFSDTVEALYSPTLNL